MPHGQRREVGLEGSSDDRCVLLELPFLEDVEDGETDCGGDGVAAEGAEELHAVVE